MKVDYQRGYIGFAAEDSVDSSTQSKGLVSGNGLIPPLEVQ